MRRRSSVTGSVTRERRAVALKRISVPFSPSLSRGTVPDSLASWRMPLPILPGASNRSSIGTRSMTSLNSEWLSVRVSAPRPQKRRSIADSNSQDCSGVRSGLPAFTVPVSSEALLAKSSKSSWLTMRSARSRTSQFSAGAKVRFSRGFRKSSERERSASPSTAMVDVSKPSAASSVAPLPICRRTAASASIRFSSTRILAEGSGTGTPPRTRLLSASRKLKVRSIRPSMVSGSVGR